jgi:DHA1 family bicyclomycin/chloramphenicol resistance-like MFS transporter
MAEATANAHAREASARPSQGLFRATTGMIALLTALSALGQFASNIYTPSLPAVARDLGASAGLVQLTLAAFLASFAVAQLLYGPLSDRFGRRGVLFAGLGVFLVGTAGCALAPSVSALLAWRIVQAAGAAAGIVIARAVIRDVFDGVELARVMALVTMAFALVPGLTPLLGGVVQDLAGWRPAFWLTLAIGAGLTAVAAAKLPESNLRPLDRLDLKGAMAGYARVLGDATFTRYALAVAFVFTGMSAFFAGSPAVFIDRLGVSSTEYGLYPPLAVTGFIIGGAVTRRLSGRVPADRLAGVGLLVLAGSALAMLAVLGGLLVHKHVINAAMVVHVTGLGIFMPTAMATAIGRFPDRAGTAAAAIGCLQMMGGGAGALGASALQAAWPLLAFPAVMAAGSVLAVAVFTVRRPAIDRPPSRRG